MWHETNRCQNSCIVRGESTVNARFHPRSIWGTWPQNFRADHRRRAIWNGTHTAVFELSKRAMGWVARPKGLHGDRLKRPFNRYVSYLAGWAKSWVQPPDPKDSNTDILDRLWLWHANFKLHRTEFMKPTLTSWNQPSAVMTVEPHLSTMKYELALNN